MRPSSPRGPSPRAPQGAPQAWGAGSTLGREVSGITDPTQDDEWTIKSPFGGGPRWDAVQPVNHSPNQPMDSLESARQKLVDQRYQDSIPVPEMGPFASIKAGLVGPGGGGMTTLQGINAASSLLNKVQKGTGTWQGGAWSGPLGSAPSHHGWAGLQDYAKEWALRTLGQFPQLYFASGYRSPAANAALPNAAPNSGHMRGVKVDFGGKLADLKLAAAWLRQFGAQTYIHPPGKEGYHLDVSFAPIGRA